MLSEKAGLKFLSEILTGKYKFYIKQTLGMEMMR